MYASVRAKLGQEVAIMLGSINLRDMTGETGSEGFQSPPCPPCENLLARPFGTHKHHKQQHLDKSQRTSALLVRPSYHYALLAELTQLHTIRLHVSMSPSLLPLTVPTDLLNFFLLDLSRDSHSLLSIYLGACSCDLSVRYIIHTYVRHAGRR